MKKGDYIITDNGEKKVLNADAKYKKGDVVYFFINIGFYIDIKILKINEIVNVIANKPIYNFEDADSPSESEDYLYTKEELLKIINQEIENMELNYEN